MFYSSLFQQKYQGSSLEIGHHDGFMLPKRFVGLALAFSEF